MRWNITTEPVGCVVGHVAVDKVWYLVTFSTNDQQAVCDRLISTGAEDILQDREKSPTWVTNGPFPPLNDIYCSLLKQFNWTKVYVGVDVSSPPYFTKGYMIVTDKLTSCGVQFTKVELSTLDFPRYMDAILVDFQAKARSKMRNH